MRKKPPGVLDGGRGAVYDEVLERYRGSQLKFSGIESRNNRSEIGGTVSWSVRNDFGGVRPSLGSPRDTGFAFSTRYPFSIRLSPSRAPRSALDMSPMAIARFLTRSSSLSDLVSRASS